MSFIGATILIIAGASFKEYFKIVAFKIRLFSSHFVERQDGFNTVTFITYDFESIQGKLASEYVNV